MTPGPKVNIKGSQIQGKVLVSSGLYVQLPTRQQIKNLKNTSTQHV